MHKTAGDLKPKDQFILAGGHYEILDVYDTSDDEMIRVAFKPVNQKAPRRLTLILDRDALFVTI